MTRQKKTNSDLANMAQATIKGRASGAGTGAPVDLTAAEVLTIIGGGGGITQLTGDVTAGPGSGSQAATIANDAVTSPKLATQDYIRLDTTPTGVPTQAGTISWNATDHTADLQLDNGVVLQIGEETLLIGVNKTGVDIADGKVVKIVGSQGQRVSIALADNTTPGDTHSTIGVTTQAIAKNDEGYICIRGLVRGLNTNSFTEGMPLYLSTAGTLTETFPVKPAEVLHVAVCVKKDGGNGSIFVSTAGIPTLGELSNVNTTGEADNYPLVFDGTLWKPERLPLGGIADIIGPSIIGLVSGTSAPVALTPAQVRAIDGTANITLDPTGFSDPSAVVINYDPATQKVTLTGTWVAYWHGQVITALTSGWVSAAHTNTTGHIYRLYYDGTNFTWLTDTDWPSFSVVMIVSVNYGASDKYAIRECHGLMNWQAHEVFHETIGTYRESGGVLGSWVAASTTAGDRRPTVTATTIHDEDIITVNPALTSDLYTQMKLAGAAVTTYTVDAAEIVPVLAANPYYNLFSTPNWTQVLMANNSYMCVWLVAIPVTASVASQKYRYLWVQGQSNTISLATQQALTPSDLNLGTLAAEATEFVFIAKVIIRYTGGNWDITSVTSLTGNKFIQVGIPAGAYLSTVAVDATLTGDGTVSSPLHVVGGSIIYQRNLAAALSLANGECLVVAGYINASTYSITLSGDARLEIL